MSDAQDRQLERVERVISVLLRVGVVVSLLVVVAGTVVSFVHHPAYLYSATDLGYLTKPGGAVPRTLGDVAAGVRAGRGQAIVVAGLLLLVATPVLRVAVAVAAFLLQKDRVFALITAVVLALLLLSFFLGRAGE
jgi:uncharacterized membrane protein